MCCITCVACLQVGRLIWALLGHLILFFSIPPSLDYEATMTLVHLLLHPSPHSEIKMTKIIKTKLQLAYFLHWEASCLRVTNMYADILKSTTSGRKYDFCNSSITVQTCFLWHYKPGYYSEILSSVIVEIWPLQSYWVTKYRFLVWMLHVAIPCSLSRETYYHSVYRDIHQGGWISFPLLSMLGF